MSEQAKGHLESLLRRCASADPEEAVTWEDPLSIELSGKYVNVLFTTGGPHFEVLIELDEEVEGFFEGTAMGGFAIYKDWFEGEACLMSALEAQAILDAIMRDPEDLRTEDEDDDR